MLIPRSTPLSSGAIAGAVVGSVVGALLLALCLFPLVVGARRRRLRARHDGDPGLAEMGQAPGGPIPADDSSYKNSSGSALEAVNTVDEARQPPVAPSASVTVQHDPLSPGPSPTSPPPKTDLQPQGDRQEPSPATAPSPARSPAATSSTPRYGSRTTAGRESTRDLSGSDSYGPPSRELTSITSVGITAEPESFDRPSGSREHSHFHLPDSIRNLLHSRRSSHLRRDSKRSTQAGTESARSPSIATNDVLPQLEPTSSGLEIDTETPGLAWDYFHDPTLGAEVYDSFPHSLPAPVSAAAAPSTDAPAPVPLGSALPASQIPATAGDTVPHLTARPITEEPDAISSDTDATATPAQSSKQNTALQGKRLGGSLQRTDSLPPPTIVADLPSPPLLQYNIGPSGNPMEMMKPTNPTESAWMLEHEMRLIQSAPPLPAHEPQLPISVPLDEGQGALFGHDLLKPEPPPAFQPPFQSPYQSPPQAASEFEIEMHKPIPEQPPGFNEPNVLTTPDYSTPPPSTGPSTQSTPNTKLTPFTASPSPPAEMEATINSQLRPPSPGISAGASPSPGPSLSPGLSPDISRGRSPGPTPSRSPGASPGRSPARPPGGFVCDVCGVVKSSYHQFNHHRRYHDRPYECTHPGCGRSFGTITHLNRHVNDKHVKTRKFYCTQPDCAYSRQGGKSFPRKDNWKRHMMNKHHIDPQNETDEEVLADVAMDET
ncbi:50799b07-e1f8-4da4-91bb-c4ab4e9774d0 [Thermothielavioides terrestris]|uniref:C2H2-type domain-containing protein n=2 Tax=Thermothielavioides terrestris TaxID=2587410 RepID=G2R4J7_THETT|nr:uncharacterized protein THITE_2112027 [Thermothielavioides terrestris NRRL 8126]AEO65232.1 hypothetical protein THITE_2112027 [Thermothielavioides terrestris NRRL 8126]SPQ19521.1 50799b07-e1f8-4da4-91bb-c4ab4e9774d0 [Thermothielavioides terrestris]